MTRMLALVDVVVRATGVHNPATQPDHPFIYVDVAAVDNQTKTIRGARRLKGSRAPSRARKLIASQDVLVSTVRPNLNAVALVPPELDAQIASTGLCVLRAREGVVLPEYLFYFARSTAFVDGLVKLVSGAMYPAVTDRQVLEQVLPVPSLAGQRRIVDLLSRADGIVRLRREAHAKARAVIPALFLDMFGEPTRNPKRWETVLLGDLLSGGPTNGIYKHRSRYGSGTPILRIDGFHDGKVTDLGALQRVMLDSESERSRFALSPDDTVINRVNSPEYLGKTAIIPPLVEPTVYESNMMRLTVDTTRAHPEYINALLQTRAARAHLLSRAKHAINQSSINQQDVKSLPVILPPLETQTRFVEASRALSGILDQQAKASDRAATVLQSLLSRAFSRDGMPHAARLAVEGRS